MIDAGTKKGEMRRGAALGEFLLGVLDQRQAADAGPHQNPDALGMRFVERVAGGQAGVLDGLDGCRHAEVDEAVHVAGFLARDVLLDLESLHLAGEPDRQGGGIELGDVGDAAAAGQQVGPAFGHRVADRADEPEAGDDDSTTARHPIGAMQRRQRV